MSDEHGKLGRIPMVHTGVDEPPKPFTWLGTGPMSDVDLAKCAGARHLLPDPGPEVVGRLLETIASMRHPGVLQGAGEPPRIGDKEPGERALGILRWRDVPLDFRAGWVSVENGLGKPPGVMLRGTSKPGFRGGLRVLVNRDVEDGDDYPAPIVRWTGVGIERDISVSFASQAELFDECLRLLREGFAERDGKRVEDRAPLPVHERRWAKATPLARYEESGFFVELRRG